MGATPVGVGGGIVWVELNGLGEVGYGAVEIKCLEMCSPPSEIGGGIIGDSIPSRWCNPRWDIYLWLLVPIRTCPASQTAKLLKKT